MTLTQASQPTALLPAEQPPRPVWQPVPLALEWKTVGLPRFAAQVLPVLLLAPLEKPRL